MHLRFLFSASLCLTAMLVRAAPGPVVATQAVDSLLEELAGNTTAGLLDDIGLDARAPKPTEEYWFRYEATDVTTKDTILELASRPGQKDYDDQAYKWITTDYTKATRQRSGRIPAIYVLPIGTRDRILKAAKDFEAQVQKKEATAYVEKDHEPNDVGINGIAELTNGGTPLAAFRGEVKRSVFKLRDSGSQQFLTWTGSKKTNSATKEDQARLNSLW